MGRVCGTYGEKIQMHVGFWWANLNSHLARDRISLDAGITVNFAE